MFGAPVSGPLSVPTPASPSVATLYRNIWRYAAGKRVQLIASTFLLVASQIAKLVVPWLAAQAINELQQGGTEAMVRAALWVGGVLLVYSGAWGLHGPGRVLERSVGVHVRQGIAAALYAKLTHAPLAWHERHHSGDVQHRVNQASHALYDFAQNQFMYLQNAVNFVGPLAALWLLSPTTGWVGLIGYVIVGIVIVRFDIVLMRLAERENRAERRYAAGLLDFIGNIATVMSLRLQSSTQRLLGRRLDAVFEPLKRTIVVNEMKWCAVDVMSICLTWGLVVAFVWETRSHGAAVLIGTVFMIYQYGQQAGSVIGTMAANFQSFAKTRTDFASADVVWAAPERAPAERSLPADWQQIQIRDLSFAHAGANDEGGLTRGGLSHVSLTLRRGERVALVGPSGSGKSTLMRVLAGLYETPHGHYEADGVAQLGVRHLGAISTLIPQEADVFEATVRENITFDEPCEPSQLMAAVHASAFDDVLQTMPLGLDTPISERGFNMSGGQRQRLCLARGVLAARESTLVLLDEPTSALDPITEALVHRRLDTSFADACIVASVHRMSLLDQFDRVVLMVAGRVVDSGSAQELAQRQPAFAEMLNAHRREDRAPVAA